jgi:predicted ATPase
MFESIKFQNFKALRDTTLPLSRFTLIVGPNGSGKTTALKAFQVLQNPNFLTGNRTAGISDDHPVQLLATWKSEDPHIGDSKVSSHWGKNMGSWGPEFGGRAEQAQMALYRSRIFSLEADAIAMPVHLQPNRELGANGANLAGVLDRLRDQRPERFEALNDQLGRWIPEFDKVLFETPATGQRSIALRTRNGGHLIKASNLSQGTLIALALLTIAYLPEPPSIVCLEEPDHGLHPRLLRDVRDALYRLAYPESSQEQREPVQVIATTHNPYFLDLFREHPEEIVIAEKVGLESKFSRLSDRTDLEEILGDAPLSEVWYSGVLGGVPVGT